MLVFLGSEPSMSHTFRVAPGGIGAGVAVTLVLNRLLELESDSYGSGPGQAPRTASRDAEPERVSSRAGRP